MAEARETWGKPSELEKVESSPLITNIQTPIRPAAGSGFLEGFFRSAWTFICFVVFCGFSFFLGRHSVEWQIVYVGSPPPPPPVVASKLPENAP